MNLRCSVCGGQAPSRRQWWNQDHGFGICPRCFQAAVKREGLAETIASYGSPGIHHSIDRPVDSGLGARDK